MSPRDRTKSVNKVQSYRRLNSMEIYTTEGTRDRLKESSAFKNKE